MKKIIKSILMVCIFVSVNACSSSDKDINGTWKMIDTTLAEPDPDFNLRTFTITDNILLMDDEDDSYNFNLNYDEFLDMANSNKKEENLNLKDLKEFNSVMNKLGYEADTMDNFYFAEAEFCFVLVDGGNKLILLTPFNGFDDSYEGWLYERVEIKK